MTTAEQRRTTMREWRNALRMTRTEFSILLKIGAERLASYESGRVPWPDKIFNPGVIAVQNDAIALREHLAKLLPPEQRGYSMKSIYVASSAAELATILRENT